MKKENFEIALLQEVDIGNKRTKNLDIFKEIAQKTPQFQYGVWGCEFEELDSPKRSKSTAGGGVHGNAILSIFPILDCGTIIHKKIYDWENGLRFIFFFFWLFLAVFSCF